MLTCLQIHADEEQGDVLIFLPGQEDIEALMSLLTDHLPSVEPKYLKADTETVIGIQNGNYNHTNKTTNSNNDNVEQISKKVKLNNNSNNNSSNTRNNGNNNSKNDINTNNTNTTENANNSINSTSDYTHFDIRPLYSAMASEEQLLVFQPSLPHIRKFILSTNIAETSVTISGIKYVVDTGFVKSRLMQPKTGTLYVSLYVYVCAYV